MRNQQQQKGVALLVAILAKQVMLGTLLATWLSTGWASWSLFPRHATAADTNSASAAYTQSAVAKTASLRQHATDFVISFEHRLTTLVKDTIDSLHYTKYKLGGTHFDADRGVYIVDCSQFVDHLLKETHPTAFSNLVDVSGTLNPTTQDYYQFFKGLHEARNPYWSKVDDVTELRAGDILVFRNQAHYRHNSSGHIMVVMDKPIKANHALYLRVADSAPVRHSEDTRELHASGIGIGTLLLKVNPTTDQPYAYAWQEGSRWIKNVKFAMARPVELD